MKLKRGFSGRTCTRASGSSASSGAELLKPLPKWRKFGLALLVLAVLGCLGRAILPWAVRDYVNQTLDLNPLYHGNIGKVRLHLWRGAYSIEERNPS